jgi:hypothetical protein NreA
MIYGYARVSTDGQSVDAQLRQLTKAGCKKVFHKTHPDILKRLKRAAGHLNGVIEKIEAGRPCLDLAQQLHAVESAITNAKRTLIHDHLDHCLEATVGAVSRDQRAPCRLDDLAHAARSA